MSWWRAFDSALEEAVTIASAIGRPELVGLAVAGQQHGMICVDDAGEVLRPAKLWCDTTSTDDADWLVAQLPGGAAAWAAACGSVPVAAFTITKLRWLRRNEPATWARLGGVMLPHDWLTYRLVGRRVTDRGDASGTGYFDPSTDRYRGDLLALVDGDKDWANLLPEVLGPRDVAGEREGIVVAAGTGDNMAAALGLGLGVGDVAVSLGTSGTVFSVSDTPTHDGSGAVAGFADATGRYLPLVCTMNATKVTDAVARLCGLDRAAFDAAALSVASSGELTLLPYLDGERTPNRPGASGVMSGLRSDVSVGAFARAAFEGVVCGLLDGLDELARHARADGALHLLGGGARSEAYRQVLADLSGRVVITSSEPELVALGACIQAAAVVEGLAPKLMAERWMLGELRHTEPTPQSAIAAADTRDRYAELRSAQRT